MKTIPLTKGKFTIVDDDDFEWLNSFKWFYLSTGYAARNPRDNETSTNTILMHRFILNLNGIPQADHISGDRLDNRRGNLRVVTPHENAFNRGRNRNNRSGFKGVCWHVCANKWRAYINLNRRQIHLGLFKDKNDARDAYRTAVVKYHGRCAHV
jgi:hypothetical protein